MSLMASHNILPYSKFPVPQPTTADYGSLRQLGVESVTRPTGLGTERTHQPANASVNTFESFADPALCITPEKPTSKQWRSFQDGASDDEDGVHRAIPPSKDKAAQRVRFDQNIKIKHMSPEYLGEANEDPEKSSCGPTIQPKVSSVAKLKSRSPERQADKVRVESSKVQKSSAYNVNSYMDYIEISGAPDHLDSGSDLEPIQVAATDVKDITKCLSTSHRRKTKGKKKPRKTKPGKESNVLGSGQSPIFGQSTTSSISPVGSMQSGSQEHVFARPEFHTTLRLSKEIQQIQQEELDLSTAVKQKLDVSGKARTQIAEKAASKLNTETSQFCSLIPVDIREDSLIQYVEREESAKARNAQLSKPKMPEELEGLEPDIMEFFTSELQHEAASYSLEGLNLPRFGPRGAEPTRAFDVYKHIRAWEGW